MGLARSLLLAALSLSVITQIEHSGTSSAGKTSFLCSWLPKVLYGSCGLPGAFPVS